MKGLFTLLALISIFLFACGENSTPKSNITNEEITKVKDIAIPVTKKFLQSLKSELKSGLQKGGPIAAIEVCNQRAPEIATEIAESSNNKIEIKRISKKNRNPHNIPDEIDEIAFSKFEKKIASGEKVSDYIILKQNDSYYFYKPLFIAPVCLNCHGDTSTMDSLLIKKIKKFYPHDKATGYKEGDFRGLVRVKINGEI